MFWYFNRRHMGRVLCKLFWEVDTTTVRLILAVSSLIWALSLCFSGSIVAQMPGFKHLLPIAGVDIWVTLYFLHFTGVLWRFFDPTPRIVWALSINVLGLAIWMCPTFSSIYEFGTIGPQAAIGLTISIFGAWALYRTGLGKEMVTP